MDIDAIAKQMPALLAFKAKVEGMIAGAGEAKSDAHDDLNELLAFKGEFQGMLPVIEKTVSDVSGVVADLDAIKKDLAPALAWIAEQQKKAEAEKTANLETSEVVRQENPTQT